MQWWDAQNRSKFAEVKAKLPGTLSLHADPTDEADRYILEGLKKPALVVGKVVCVWTPNLKARSLVARALVDRAINGDVPAIKEIFDRSDGKVSTLSGSGEGDGLTLEDLIHMSYKAGSTQSFSGDAR